MRGAADKEVNGEAMTKYALIISNDTTRPDAARRMLSGLDRFKLFVTSPAADAPKGCDCAYASPGDAPDLVRKLKSRITPEDELFVSFMGGASAEGELFSLIAELPYSKRTIVSDAQSLASASRLFADDGKSALISAPDYVVKKGRVADNNSDGTVSNNEANSWTYASGIFWPVFALLSEDLKVESLKYLLFAPEVDPLTRVEALTVYVDMAQAKPSLIPVAIMTIQGLFRNEDEYVRGAAKEIYSSFWLSTISEDSINTRLEHFLGALKRQTSEREIYRQFRFFLGLLPTNKKRIEFLDRVSAKFTFERTVSMIRFAGRDMTREFPELQPRISNAIREMAACGNEAYEPAFAEAYISSFSARSGRASQKEIDEFREFISLPRTKKNAAVMGEFWGSVARFHPSALAQVLESLLQDVDAKLFQSAVETYAQIAPNISESAVPERIEFLRNFFGENTHGNTEAVAAYIALVKKLDEEALVREISALKERYVENPMLYTLAYLKLSELLPRDILMRKALEIKAEIVKSEGERREALCSIYLMFAGRLSDREMELDILPYLDSMTAGVLLILYRAEALGDPADKRANKIRFLSRIMENSPPPQIRKILLNHCAVLKNSMPSEYKKKMANQCLPGRRRMK